MLVLELCPQTATFSLNFLTKYNFQILYFKVLTLASPLPKMSTHLEEHVCVLAPWYLMSVDLSTGSLSTWIKAPVHTSDLEERVNLT